MSPVEMTLKYATTVRGLAAAWEFVMAHVDEVGPDPQILISPIWSANDDDFRHRSFEVSVSGMVEKS